MRFFIKNNINLGARVFIVNLSRFKWLLLMLALLGSFSVNASHFRGGGDQLASYCT